MLSRQSPLPVGRASLELSGVTAAFGEQVVLDSVDLSVAEGEMLSLLGPSGCGKTTLLRVMAGLHVPQGGTVTVGDQIVSGPGRFVAPERRRIGMVFQDGALFPHLTVADNVRFGLRGRPDVELRTQQVLELVDLQRYADRRPGTLSGGQQQRVALARALAPEPAVLLLDEPFSALDAGLRLQVRRDVKRILTDLGITVVVVTHDQEEAFVLGDRVAVMNAGRIVQAGVPSELYEHPADPWIAEFVGEANFVDGVRQGFAVDSIVGHVSVRGGEQSADGPVTVLIRPEQLAIVPGDSGSVRAVEYFGHDALFDVELDSGEQLDVRMALATFDVGARVDVKFVGSSVSTWPIASDDRLAV